jgi:hypothetical protein
LFDCVYDNVSCKTAEEIKYHDLKNMILMMNNREWYQRSEASEILSRFAERLTLNTIYEKIERKGESDLKIIVSYHQKIQSKILLDLSDIIAYPLYNEKKDRK